jgi:hypothetical protein
VWNWVQVVRRPLIGLLYQPRMIDEYRAFGKMGIGRGDRSTRRKPAPVPLFPPVSAVESRQPTAWAMARSSVLIKMNIDSAGFEILIAVIVKRSVFWIVMPCSSETAKHFRGIYCLQLHSFLVYRSTLKMETICYSETSSFSELYGVITQNILLLNIVTDVFVKT